MSDIGRGAPFAGSVAGWLFAEHYGAPVFVVLIAMTGGLVFGMLAAYGRARDRVSAGRFALYNVGALWVAAFFVVFKGGFDFYSAAGLGLAIGLAGAPFLEYFEHRLLGDAGYQPPDKPGS